MIRTCACAAVLILLIGLFPSCLARGQERRLIDDTGRMIKIRASPKKIISLAPSITEVLFALGLNQEIAAVTDFCDYPEAALKKPKIGGFVNPSLEKIVSLDPDLIIGIRDGNRTETIHRLEELALPVFVIDPKGFEGVITTLRKIGKLVGRQDESKRVISEMKMRKEKVVSVTRSLPRPKVFFQIGHLPMITVGKGTLADDLIRLSGGRSISEHEAVEYPSYNIEIVAQKGPDIILVSSMESKKVYGSLIKMWQDWKSIPAVRNNAIHVIDSNIVDRPTPRIAEGLEVMARLIHQEAFDK